ncbi:hypothetical protein [Streptomyces sp. 6N223]|uniref:hypothetical protein n=1 Tax=Streptomyces sp. 6N223 TaxID=3457412 RepID=UPI003FD4FC1A
MTSRVPIRQLQEHASEIADRAAVLTPGALRPAPCVRLKLDDPRDCDEMAANAA